MHFQLVGGFVLNFLRTMSQIFIPHCDHVRAYTFPLVRSLLDGAVGIPSTLKTIPPPYRDGLVATLATELANITAVILQLGKKTSYNCRIQEQLLELHGGSSYYAAITKLRSVGAERNRVTDELRRLERLAYTVSDRFPEAIPGSVIEAGEYGATTRWRYDIIPAERIDYIRAHLGEVMSREKELKCEVDVLHQAFLDHGTATKNLPGYRADFARLSWKQIRADFTISPGTQASGAALFLRNINYSWWVSFTNAFEEAVESDGLRRLDRMALRDPPVLREIRELCGGKSNWYRSASEYFREHSHEWGMVKRTPKALKRVRKDLISQDQESMEWLKTKDRAANFYSLWIRNLNRDVERSDKEGYWFPSTIEREWLRSNFERFCTGPVFENEDWRFNELSWCLSQEHSDLYDFVPLVSHHQNLEAWEAHRAKWWAEIEAARLGVPQGPKIAENLGPGSAGGNAQTDAIQAGAVEIIKHSVCKCKRTTRKARTRSRR